MTAALRQTMADDPIRRIQWRLTEMRTGRATIEDRLVHWRTISRICADEYDRELQQLDSLNSIKSDPSCEVPIV